MITLRFFHWLSIHLPMRIVSLYQSNGLYFKDDAIGYGRVSDRILAEIEDNHMRERDTKLD